MGSGFWDVHFRANQVQTDAPFFKMPLELRIRLENTGDTIVRVMNDYNVQDFTIRFNERPVSLTFDPNNQILLKEGSTVVSTSLIAASKTALMKPEPNPASDKVTIKYSLEKPSKISLAISDMNGKMVYQTGSMHKTSGDQTQLVDLSGIPSGSYLIQFTTDEVRLTEKLLIVK